MLAFALAGAAAVSPQDSSAAPPTAVELLGEGTRSMELAEVLLAQEDYQASIREAQASLAAWDKLFSPRAQSAGARELAKQLRDRPELYVLRTLLALSEALIESGDYARPEPHLKRAVALGEGASGDTKAYLSAALCQLGRLSTRRGEHARAEPILERALAVFSRPHFRATAQAYAALAALHVEMGRYAQAEALYDRALDPTPSYRTHLLLGKAELALVNADYVLAGRALEEAKRRPGFPTEGATGARRLVALARLHQQSGAPNRGEPDATRALAIQEKSLGPKHPAIGATLEVLAAVELEKGAPDRAEPLITRALSIYDEALGAEHPGRAAALVLAGRALAARGDAAGAEGRYRRAIELLEKAFGATHPAIAGPSEALGDVLRARGDAAGAVERYQRAIDVREKALKPDHPAVAATLDRIGSMHLQNGNTKSAIRALEASLAMRDRRALALLATPGEDPKAADAAALKAQTDLILSAGRQGGEAERAALDLGLTAILRRKGRALDFAADSRAALRDRLGKDDVLLLDELVAIESKIVDLIVRGPGGLPPERHSAAVAELREEKEKLEVKVRLAAAPLLEGSGLVTLEQVRKQIPKGAALVEIMAYRPLVRAGDGTRSGRSTEPFERWGEPRYVAYAMRQDGIASIDLGSAAPIDALAAELRAALASAFADPTRAARALDARVMQPLTTILGGARWILLSPDGDLNLVPFGALLDEKGRHRIEGASFTYLTSGRDLLRYAYEDTPREPGVAALVVGAPDFGPMQRKPSRFRREVPEGVALNQRSIDMDKILFPPLAGTAVEARAIAKDIPGTRLLIGAEATEEAVKAGRHPRILHLATHGFFLPSKPEGAPLSAARGGEAVVMGAAPEAPLDENPLLRSGVALASANRPAPGKEDGILTALEASGLDLYGTKLVVLSACETGVGEARRGDGVYGLRRALVLAGAETQVMSLWKISDRATTDLMVGYYARLRAGGGRSEAMRQAQLALLSAPETRHPYYWASFVVSGNGASLDGAPVAPAPFARARVEPGPRGCACEAAGGAREGWGAGVFAAIAVAMGMRRGRRRACS